MKKFLDEKVAVYNHLSFIPNDPISIPHKFSRLQDIEIIAFWTAVLAWGQRKTIINKANELIELMGNEPHEFILHHTEYDAKKFLSFKHRTFNATDTLYFLHFFKSYYAKNNSLENAFLCERYVEKETTEEMLKHFHNTFFSLEDVPHRTKKHIPTPARKSTCKRLNMFLRWMVRKDNCGVDFGLWGKIKPSQLVCPLDVHVERVARKLGLISRKQTDWLTALELTKNLKQFDAVDPVQYDFALFGMGVMEKMA
ncbi:MAG: TIGR02757 family protein [Chitinophagales bacterium]